jgi:hypothetical protein
VDIPVLKYVDVLIGLSLTMVLLSTIVLAVTQVILNSSSARPRHLKRGLVRLIFQLDPDTMRPHALYLARSFLRHPLIAQQTALTPVRIALQRFRLMSGGWIGDPTFREKVELVLPTSPGSVIQREELAYMMIELAAGEGPLMDPADQGVPPPRLLAAQTALADALRGRGIEDPAATLRAIRIKLVENERAQPDQAASRWRSNAIADSAPSDFVGMLHASFDNTIARVTDAFASESKLWASGVALIVAVTLQIDSFALVKRLALNDADRAAFVQAAQDFVKERDAAATPTEKANKQAAVDQANQALTLLASPSLNLLPAGALLNPVDVVLGRAQPDVYKRWPGVLFTWVLVSLGSPFWFDMLKNLLKLRSLLAKQDEEERKKRQDESTTKTTASAPKDTPPSPLVPLGAAEVGDLSATGAIG